MADFTQVLSPSKLSRSSVFFASESPRERFKREKRSNDIQRLLSPTHNYHCQLSTRVTDLKSYMDQEFQSGIRTMEILMIRELEQRTKIVRKLERRLKRSEESLDKGEEIVRLKREIEVCREREEGLSAQEAELRRGKSMWKDKAEGLRGQNDEKGRELREMLRENYRLEGEVSKCTEIVMGRREKSNSSFGLSERLKAALPPLSVLSGLSPSNLGAMKLKELHGYKSIRERVNSMKGQVKSQQLEVRSMRIRQATLTQSLQALEKLYDDGLAALQQSLTADVLPLPSLRVSSSAPNLKVTLAVLSLGSRDKLASSLKEKVFGRNSASADSTPVSP